MATNRGPGRPASQQAAGVREELIEAARRLFLRKDFHKVSVREIAREAGANSAMIRYYFGSKQGLYEAMLAGMLHPIQDELDRELQREAPDLLRVAHTHAAICLQHPELVVLLTRTLTMGEGPSREFLLERFARANMRRLSRVIGKRVERSGIHADMDPDLLRVALVSLMVGPQILRPVLEAVLEREVDEAFFHDLVEQNVRMLARGAGLDRAISGGTA